MDNVPVVGVIWLGKWDARATLAALPSGSREEINVEGYPFCFWKPHRQRLARKKKRFTSIGLALRTTPWHLRAQDIKSLMND